MPNIVICNPRTPGPYGTGARSSVERAMATGQREPLFYARNLDARLFEDGLASRGPAFTARGIRFMDATRLQKARAGTHKRRAPWGGNPEHQGLRAWSFHDRPGYLLTAELPYEDLHKAAAACKAAGWSFAYLGEAWALRLLWNRQSLRLVMFAPPRGLDAVAISSTLKAAEPNGYQVTLYGQNATAGTRAFRKTCLPPDKVHQARLRS